MANRHIRAFGIPPLVGYVVLLIGFVGFSFYFFQKAGWAVYIYVLFGLSFIAKFSRRPRNDLLKISFRKKEYRTIRIVENLLTTLPFTLFLAYKLELWAILSLVFLAVLMASGNYQLTPTKTLPTPFFKRPFEFTVGFRKTFYWFGLAYFLTFMSIGVGNFNLGAFAMMLMYFITLSFYSEPEQEFYVWIHSMTSGRFLWHKMKTYAIYSSLLILPIMIALAVIFSENIGVLMGLFFLGHIYVGLVILAKYSAYPSKINIPDGFLIGLSFIFPPILIATIPFFWRKSRHRLNSLFE